MGDKAVIAMKSQKVWVLTAETHDCSTVIGIFSSNRAAANHLSLITSRGITFICSFDINEFEINNPNDVQSDFISKRAWKNP